MDGMEGPIDMAIDKALLDPLLARREPQELFAKYQRRFPDFDDKIISIYARGMTLHEIRGHLEELYGIDVSPDLISTMTGAVLEAVAEWQGRPLDACYPLVFFDAIRVKIRDKAFGRNKAVYRASHADLFRRSTPDLV
jgi:putative transposase